MPCTYKTFLRMQSRQQVRLWQVRQGLLIWFQWKPLNVITDNVIIVRSKIPSLKALFIDVWLWIMESFWLCPKVIALSVFHTIYKSRNALICSTILQSKDFLTVFSFFFTLDPYGSSNVNSGRNINAPATCKLFRPWAFTSASAVSAVERFLAVPSVKSSCKQFRCNMQTCLFLLDYMIRIWCCMMEHDLAWWNMLEHDGTWWNMMKHDVTWCNMMDHDAIWWNVIQHDETWFNCDTTQCNMIQLWYNIM